MTFKEKYWGSDEFTLRMADLKDECVEIIKAHGYYKYWVALVDTTIGETVDIAVAITNEANSEGEDKAWSHKRLMAMLEMIWHERGINEAGLSPAEYWAHPDAPLWERDDLYWDEEEEDWVEK